MTNDIDYKLRYHVCIPNTLIRWSRFAIGRFHLQKREETLKLARMGKLEVVLTTFETARYLRFIIHKPIKYGTYCIILSLHCSEITLTI